MRMYDIIYKKRQGEELTGEEINFFIRGYTTGLIPDYQAAALLMAIYFRGLTPRETADLTTAIVDSGRVMDLSPIDGVKVDKHSTGGVGDKTTLVVAPMVAAAGIPIAKMSGRGLGHTGGTIDKLESIPGFRTEMDSTAFVEQVRRINIALAAQTGELAPADKKLYALRDVTATVDSIPLIAASVMSKKIASGADAVVLDVKVGSGAFVQELEKAFELAEMMVNIGRRVGRNTVALITSMDQPLGYAVGNSLEVKEALAALRGEGPEDLMELCFALGARMLLLAGAAADLDEAKKILERVLREGQALEKFSELVTAQGGDPGFIHNPDRLPAASLKKDLVAGCGGYVESIRTTDVGRAAVLLGAGRETKDSTIDPAVGVVICKKVGEPVTAGETLAVLHANDPDRLARAEDVLEKAFTISDRKPLEKPLILGEVPPNY